jgi:Ca2+/Na+ antiporter
MKEILERIKAPTPKFFKRLRSIGISVAAIGATLLAAPVALPDVIINIAGYLVTAGGVLGIVSQTTKMDKK